ncbi:hypothetical protein HY991_02105 [Candidatus Micrarchaeota archaeon]|nr:hypothetical protein [Candidatus Micrarchaeota archaeon]
MRVSKIGLASLLLGLTLVLGTWWFGFYNGVQGMFTKSIISAVVVTIQGGLILLGLFILFIGLLMLVI